jgi:hypothetical protein
MHKQVQVTLEQGTGPKPKTKDVIWKDGIRIRVYTIGWLRYLTCLADVTLRGWEKKEILPKPIMKLPGMTRWYSPAELVVYSSIIKSHYSSGRDLRVLKQRLAQAYVDIRRKYLGMKPGDKPSSGFDVLPNEESVERAFNKQQTDKVLNRENFYEIKQLIESGQKENRSEGDSEAPSNHQAVGGVSVGGSKLRNRNSVPQQSRVHKEGKKAR